MVYCHVVYNGVKHPMERINTKLLRIVFFISVIWPLILQAQPEYSHTVLSEESWYTFRGINNNSVLVGFKDNIGSFQIATWADGNISVPEPTNHPVTLWVYLPDPVINDSGWIAYSTAPDNYTNTGYMIKNNQLNQINVDDFKVLDINNHGQVLGSFDTSEWNYSYWQNGSNTLLADPSAEGGVFNVYHINNHTQSIGRASVVPGQGSSLIRWSGGSWEQLDFGGGYLNHQGGLFINNYGVVAGMKMYLESGEWNNFYFILDSISLQEFSVTEANNSKITGFNDHGDLITYNGFLWQNGQFYDLLSISGMSGNGWSDLNTYDMNNKGEIVARAKQNDIFYSILLRPVEFTITQPSRGDLWIGGEWQTIKWDGVAGIDSINIDYRIGPDGNLQSIVENYPAAGGQYHWAVPDSILSRNVYISISNSANPDQQAQSERFYIKDYSFTRLDATGEYERFESGKHGWAFCNCKVNLWPASWYSRFDYLYGEDEFTNLTYPSLFTEPPINAAAPFFPDWPSFVRAFSTDYAYKSLIPGIEAKYKLRAAYNWRVIHGMETWQGSCSGFAISAMLAFAHREDFGNAYPEIGPVEQIYNLAGGSLLVNQPVDDAIRELIHQMQIHWYGRAAQDHIKSAAVSTPRQTLADLKQMFIDSTNSQYGYLYISNPGGAGAHAVVPIGMESIRIGPMSNWLIKIYDPNHPDSERYILMDSLANTWEYQIANTLTWGGNSGIYLMDGVRNHLGPQEMKTSITGMPVAADSIPYIKVYVPAGNLIQAVTTSANSIYFTGNQTYNGIDGAWFINPPTGYETPPRGFELPPATYRFELNGVADSLTYLWLLTDSSDYHYQRTDTGIDESDELLYSDGLVIPNSGNQSRTFSVGSIVLLPGEERAFEISDLSSIPGDTVAFQIHERRSAVIGNRSGTSSYHLRLIRSTDDSTAWFEHSNIPLAPGAQHSISPDWSADGLPSVQIIIDQDGDGLPDDSLLVENEYDPANGIQRHVAALLPDGYRLYPNYPNPFNPETTIHFAVPAGGSGRENVTVTVFNILGQRVKTLFNGPLSSGEYSVKWNGRNDAGLAQSSGIYLVVLKGDYITKTQKITLLR